MEEDAEMIAVMDYSSGCSEIFVRLGFHRLEGRDLRDTLNRFVGTWGFCLALLDMVEYFQSNSSHSKGILIEGCMRAL